MYTGILMKGFPGRDHGPVASVIRLDAVCREAWTIAHQAPLSIGFPRQEYWSGLPFPPPGDLPMQGPNPRVSHISCTAGRLFTTEPQ